MTTRRRQQLSTKSWTPSGLANHPVRISCQYITDSKLSLSWIPEITFYES